MGAGLNFSGRVAQMYFRTSRADLENSRHPKSNRLAAGVPRREVLNQLAA